MRKITTAEALAAQIQDGATIAISGNGGGMVEAEEFSLGPAVLMFGAPGVSFVKRYYQD